MSETFTQHSRKVGEWSVLKELIASRKNEGKERSIKELSELKVVIVLERAAMRWLSGLGLDSGLAWRSFEPGFLVRLSLGRSLVVVPASLFYFPPANRRHPHPPPPAFTSKPTNDLREATKSVRICQQSMHITPQGRSFVSHYFTLPDVLLRISLQAYS